MLVAFDREKDVLNREKHGVSLAFGAEILADGNRLIVLDTRFDYAEERFVAYGEVSGRIWVCVFTVRGDGIRVISARKANDREARRYLDVPR